MSQPVQWNTNVVRRTVPLIIGGVYQLIPSMGGQYIIITAIDRRYVYAIGYGEHHTADIKVRIKRFPEIVIGLVGFDGTGSALRLTAEDGYVIMLSGDRIGLFT